MTLMQRTQPTTALGWSYVCGVAAMATLGFTTGSTASILLAAVLTVPVSIVALPAFYVGYGLLSLLPGADPSSSSGSSGCSSLDDCRVSTTGDVAAWFPIATGVLGILALTVGALLNAAVLRGLTARRHRR